MPKSSARSGMPKAMSVTPVSCQCLSRSRSGLPASTYCAGSLRVSAPAAAPAATTGGRGPQIRQRVEARAFPDRMLS